MMVEWYTWIPLRLVFGFSSAMVFMVAERWLTGAASRVTKSRVFTVYMVINKGSFGAGQLLPLLGDPSGDRLFMLTAILFGLCLVPIALGSKGAPPNIDAERIGLRDLYRFSPVGVVGAAAAGFTNAPLMGLGPIFGAKIGLGVEGVSYFMAIFLLGSLALLIAISRLSDKYDRRGVLIGVAVASAVACAAMTVLSTLGTWAILESFTISGLSAVVYPIAMALRTTMQTRKPLSRLWPDCCSPQRRRQHQSVLRRARDEMGGTRRLYLYCSVIYASLAGFTYYRRMRRVPAPETTDFVAQPQTSQ